MNRTKALEILGIDDVDEDTIKKAYRTLALKYHPDKNPAEDANERFQEIHDAYVYLHGSLEESSDYTSVLKSFLRTWISGENDVLHEWIRRITSICEEKALHLLEKIDKHILKTIYDLISKNREIMHITEDFIEKMNHVLKSKFENDERIILHPFLDDLENVYKLNIDDNLYLVPLWHHHLVYDAKDGKEIYVDCYPLLPENIWLDEYNNIHIDIVRELLHLWDQDVVSVEIGYRNIQIEKTQIRMVETQMIIVPYQGISIIHPTNLYDVSKKSNIYVHLTICLEKS
jgi:hypothetical protein